MDDKMITTYSMWAMFRDCRKMAEWRYLRKLVPMGSDKNLHFGSVIHECLEQWHKVQDLNAVQSYIDSCYPLRKSDDKQRAEWHYATAMMKGYSKRYADEAFKVIALELEFHGPIINPATGASSRTFDLAGKVDGIVEQDGQYFLLEHKTASVIDGGYLEALWCNFQIQLYSKYIEQECGMLISGTIYNILAKTRLKQKQGETDEEYEARCAELIAKSKSGKTSAKQHVGETDEEFQERLADWYSKPEAFHRELIFFDKGQLVELQAELWELSQSFLEARRRDMWYKNTRHCFHYNRPCAYLPLCRANGNPNVIEMFYENVEVNQELTGEIKPIEETFPF